MWCVCLSHNSIKFKLKQNTTLVSGVICYVISIKYINVNYFENLCKIQHFFGDFVRKNVLANLFFNSENKKGCSIIYYETSSVYHIGGI